jgi:hypothetical protein
MGQPGHCKCTGLYSWLKSMLTSTQSDLPKAAAMSSQSLSLIMYLQSVHANWPPNLAPVQLPLPAAPAARWSIR